MVVISRHDMTTSRTRIAIANQTTHRLDWRIMLSSFTPTLLDSVLRLATPTSRTRGIDIRPPARRISRSFRQALRAGPSRRWRTHAGPPLVHGEPRAELIGPGTRSLNRVTSAAAVSYTLAAQAVPLTSLVLTSCVTQIATFPIDLRRSLEQSN